MQLRLTLSGSVGGRNAKILAKYVFKSADAPFAIVSQTRGVAGTSAKTPGTEDNPIRSNRVADRLPPPTPPPTHFVRSSAKRLQRNSLRSRELFPSSADPLARRRVRASHSRLIPIFYEILHHDLFHIPRNSAYCIVTIIT